MKLSLVLLTKTKGRSIFNVYRGRGSMFSMLYLSSKQQVKLMRDYLQQTCLSDASNMASLALKLSRLYLSITYIVQCLTNLHLDWRHFLKNSIITHQFNYQSKVFVGFFLKSNQNKYSREIFLEVLVCHQDISKYVRLCEREDVNDLTH